MDDLVSTLNNKITGLVNSGVIVLRQDGRVCIWNDWMHAHSNIKSDQIVGLNLVEAIEDIAGSRIERAIKKALEFNCPSILSAKLIDADFPLFKPQVISKRKAERITQSILIKPFLHNQERHCLISIFDISSAALREKALRNQSSILSQTVDELQKKEYELQAIFNNTQNGIVVFDTKGEIVSANPAALVILELKEQALGHKIANYITELSEIDFSENNIEEQVNELLPAQLGEYETYVKTAQHNKVAVAISANSIAINEVPHRFFVFIRDISEKKKAEDTLRRLATIDPLTNLYNRNFFLQCLQQAIDKQQRANTCLTVFFIDLDRFKHVNDTAGHNAGDQLLKEVGQRMLGFLRKSDVLARWAGDEFVILTENQRSKIDAMRWCEKIINEVKKPFQIQGCRFFVNCSIGISQYPEDGKTPSDLICCADQAMYQAKADGKGIARFFKEEYNAQLQERLRMEAELRDAIDNEQFHLVYQPIVTNNTHTLIGAEALIRWKPSPDIEIGPCQFLPVAEECGLIHEIGAWVINQVMVDLEQMQHTLGRVLPISINISPKQFGHCGFVASIEHAFERSAVDPSLITLEITENHLLDSHSENLKTLSKLREIGVKIAIDDFGIGYSNLSYLSKLPVDILKIDRSFLEKIELNDANAQVINAIINIGKALELRVVAEGIETDCQLASMSASTVDYLQGFLLCKPMQLHMLGEWMATHADGSDNDSLELLSPEVTKAVSRS